MLKIFLIIILIIILLVSLNKTTTRYTHINKKNIHQHLTIGIKTFLRPHCLKECIASIRKYYKKIPIYVADDSSDNIKLKNIEVIKGFNDNNIKLFNMKYDSGLSAGRNLMVKNTKTEYFLVLDDSRTLTRDTHLEAMINFLKISNYDLIAGVCNDRGGYYKHYSKNFLYEKVDKDGIPNIYYTTITKKPIVVDKIDKNTLIAFDTNITNNFFITKTKKLLKFPWNNECKLGEHELFFYNWWKHKNTCAISFQINFGECKNKQYLEDGNRLRYRNENPKSNNYKFKHVKLIEEKT